VVAERLEVRLDPEHRRRLNEIVAARGTSASEIVRLMIDRLYDDLRLTERIRAARELAALEIEDVPEPDVLAAQLDRTYELPDLR
jgi:hypothetical protein